MHANMQSNKQMFSGISTAEVSIRFMPAYKAQEIVMETYSFKVSFHSNNPSDTFFVEDTTCIF